MKKTLVLATVLALSVLLVQSCAAQAGDDVESLRQEVQRLKENQEAIRKDLEEIKSFLRARTAPPQAPSEVFVSADDDPFLGRADAVVTLIDFSDYQ